LLASPALSAYDEDVELPAFATVPLAESPEANATLLLVISPLTSLEEIIGVEIMRKLLLTVPRSVLLLTIPKVVSLVLETIWLTWLEVSASPDVTPPPAVVCEVPSPKMIPP